MRSFNKLQGHIYYFRPEEFSKMLEVFNLQTIYGLEYAAQMYKMYKYREYTFEEFIEELNDRHQDAEERYKKIRESNLIQIGKGLNKLFDKGLGIYIVKEVRASDGYILNEEEIEVSLDSEVKYIEIFNIPDTEVRMVDIIMFFEEKKKFLV